jgi:hypothetical protein
MRTFNLLPTIVLILIFFLFFFFYPIKNSWQFRSACIEENIKFNTYENIDYLFVGSSTVRSGIDKRNFDIFKNNNIWDLSENHRGMDLNWKIIKEVLKNRKIKNIVVEINSPREKFHPYFLETLSVNELILDTPLNFKYHGIFNIPEWVRVKLNIGKNHLQDKKKFKAKNVDCSFKNEIAIEPNNFVRNDKLFAKRKHKLKAKQINFKTVDEELLEYYISKIYKLSQKYNFKLIFAYYPKYKITFLSDKSKKNLKDKYPDIHIFSLTKDQLYELYDIQHSFIDFGHLNTNGSRYFMQKLYEFLHNEKKI